MHEKKKGKKKWKTNVKVVKKCIRGLFIIIIRVIQETRKTFKFSPN